MDEYLLHLLRKTLAFCRPSQILATAMAHAAIYLTFVPWPPTAARGNRLSLRDPAVESWRRALRMPWTSGFSMEVDKNPPLETILQSEPHPPMQPIIACTDGSIYTPSIYENAAWAASRMRSPLHFVHVIERPQSPPNHDLGRSSGFHPTSELLEELARFDESYARIATLRSNAILADATRAFAGSKIEVSTSQLDGSLVDALNELEKTAALVVIGKRGEQADFNSGHLGNNLERVIRSSLVPVWITARQFRPIRRFLLAYDGGVSSLKAVNHAISQPLLQGLECHLLSVGRQDSTIERNLESAAQSLREAGFHVSAALVPGNPEEAIAAEVTTREIDLLVMGAYGHSRVRQWFLGSTTSSLIRSCLIPLLMFR
jgi:nucleotide-binding universal stress UspA family protein